MLNRVQRVCAVHRTRLYERTDPDRDTSGLYCPIPLEGEAKGHNALVWDVTVGRKVVARGSLHPTKRGEYTWRCPQFFLGMESYIKNLLDALEAPEREMRVRSVARVSESTVEDWI